MRVLVSEHPDWINSENSGTLCVPVSGSIEETRLRFLHALEQRFRVNCSGWEIVYANRHGCKADRSEHLRDQVYSAVLYRTCWTFAISVCLILRGCERRGDELNLRYDVMQRVTTRAPLTLHYLICFGFVGGSFGLAYWVIENHLYRMVDNFVWLMLGGLAPVAGLGLVALFSNDARAWGEARIILPRVLQSIHEASEELESTELKRPTRGAFS